MTAETVKTPGKYGKAKPPVREGYTASPWLGAITDGALLSWLGGIGLNKGFGVHVPFIAGWVLVTAFVLLVFTVAEHATSAYHKQAVKAAPHLAAAQMVGIAAAQAAMDHEGFADIAKKIQGE